MDVDAESDTQGTHPSGMVNGHVDDEPDKTSSEKSKSKLRLTYTEYKLMATQLILTIRRAEYQAGDGKRIGIYL